MGVLDCNLKTEELQKYATDLTMLAEKDPVIGRETEMELLIEALLKRRNSNACLTGGAGVGKTAIVGALATKIAAMSAPRRLWNKRVFSIDMDRIVDGATNRWEIEKRVKSVLEEVRGSEGGIILFIDDLHNFISLNGVATLLKRSLSIDKFQCIGATTKEEYSRLVERDGVLKGSFDTVYVREASREDSIKMVEGIVQKYASHHGVRYSKGVIASAVDLSKLYIRKEKRDCECMTELAKVLAEEYYGSEAAMVRLDMRQFAEHQAIPWLVGQLVEEVRQRPDSLVLFDEIEKAHEKVSNVLLEILDDGTLSDGKGERVDFSKTIVIVISNSESNLKDAFKVEVLDRFDQVVVFKFLEKEDMEKILQIMVQIFLFKVSSKNQLINIQISQKLMEFLVSKVEHEKSHSVRALKRAFATYVESKLAEEILIARVKKSDLITIDIDTPFKGVKVKLERE